MIKIYLRIETLINIKIKFKINYHSWSDNLSLKSDKQSHKALKTIQLRRWFKYRWDHQQSKALTTNLLLTPFRFYRPYPQFLCSLNNTNRDILYLRVSCKADTNSNFEFYA